MGTSRCPAEHLEEPAIPTNVHYILSQIKELRRGEQIIVLKRLADLVQRSEKEIDIPRLSSLAGLGKEIWKSKDEIDDYLDRERGW